MTDKAVPVVPLPTNQKACLLRAARAQMLKLGDETRRLEALPARYSISILESARDEEDCLGSAISWLWQMPDPQKL